MDLKGWLIKTKYGTCCWTKISVTAFQKVFNYINNNFKEYVGTDVQLYAQIFQIDFSSNWLHYSIAVYVAK